MSYGDYVSGDIVIYNREIKKYWFVELSDVVLEVSFKYIKFEVLVKYIVFNSDDSLGVRK